MSALKKAIVAAGLTLALGTAAYASDATGLLRGPDEGYFVDQDGRTAVGELNTPSDGLTARAQAVRPGTEFSRHKRKPIHRGRIERTSH